MAAYHSLFAFWMGGAGSTGLIPPVIPRRVVSAATSTIPAGRQLTNVAWTIRDGLGGTILSQFGGAPAAPAVGTGLEGTNLEATVSDLPATGYIELTITDSFGSTSSAGLSYE